MLVIFGLLDLFHVFKQLSSCGVGLVGTDDYILINDLEDILSEFNESLLDLGAVGSQLKHHLMVFFLVVSLIDVPQQFKPFSQSTIVLQIAHVGSIQRDVGHYDFVSVKL